MKKRRTDRTSAIDMENKAMESEAKRAVAYEFSQNELALLIRGMREVDIGWGEVQLMQMDLLERFEKELRRRFGTYVEYFKLDFEAVVFFGNAQEAAAGKCALEAAGFDIEPRPDNHAGDGGRTVWMMAYGACRGDADTREIVRNLEALLKPNGGMIWELGPIGPDGEPAFRRTNPYSLQSPTRISSNLDAAMTNEVESIRGGGADAATTAHGSPMINDLRESASASDHERSRSDG